MKVKLIITVVALLTMSLTTSAKDYKYESVNGDVLKTRIYTLDNGLKVYLSVNKERPRIQTYIAVKTGSRNDPAETTGLAHYLEHLMFKGTKHFGTSNLEKEAPLLDSIQNRFEQYRHITDPQQRKAFYHQIDSISQEAAKYNIPNEYDKLMASIGSEGSNAYTSNDVTCYTENIPSNEVDNWAKIQADRFQNMVIRGFHTELEAVYEEYNIGIARDNNKIWDALFAKVFPGHPYGTQTTIGTQEHLKNPSIVNIKEYFNRYYVPNNIAICMAGDFDPDKVIATIDKYFGAWKKSPNLSYPQYAPIKDLTAPTDTTVMGLESEYVALGWKFDGAASLQADTLDVLSEMLANGTAGLLDLDINQPMKCLGTEAENVSMNEYSTFIMAGAPNEGQTLDEVKDLLLAELEKIKKGQFSDDLLPSVISNMKLKYYTSMESNKERADALMSAFINGKQWGDVVNRLNRISGMTKKQIVDFVQRHFNNNYAVIYKKTGEDTSLKKIDKPQITGIPTNRDKTSDFVTEIANSEVEPIQPRFVDFKKDMKQAKTKKGQPVLYVKNTENGLFKAAYYYKIGTEANKWLPYATEYFDYLGTKKMNVTQLKQQFYKLACNVSFDVNTDAVSIILSGINENMPKAVALLEDFLANAKVDKEAYDNYVAQVEKSRKDYMLDQSTNYQNLCLYGQYGKYNPALNCPSVAELKNKNPQELVDMVKGLKDYEHTLLYYGPSDVEAFANVMDKAHKTGKALHAVPTAKEYTEQPTPQNEIIIAPYEAKNIYMRMYHNDSKKFDLAQLPIVKLFNEYYGGGMNTVVFQELRESRALAYNALAMYNTPKRKNGTESFYAHIISQNDKLLDCISTFKNIIDTIPQSLQAFQLAKQALLKRLASARTTKFDIITNYLDNQKLGVDYSLDEKVYKALPSITLDDIVKFEKQNIANKPFRYLILGDEKELDMKALEKIAPIRRVSTKDIFKF